MKTTKKQFELFKKTFLDCMDKWRVTGWKFDFYHIKGESDEMSAWVKRDLTNKSVAVSFNTETFEGSNINDEFIRWLARHEAIHILIGRLAVCGSSRFVTEDELNEAEEELVNHLEILLP